MINIVYEWLSLMSTQEAPHTTLILHVHFDLTSYSIMSERYFRRILLVEMFPLTYSSHFEIYSCLKLVTIISGLKPYGVVGWHSLLVVLIQ